MVGGVGPGGGGLCCLAPGKTATLPVAMEPVLSARLHDLTTTKRRILVEKVKGLSLYVAMFCIVYYERERERERERKFEREEERIAKN